MSDGAAETLDEALDFLAAGEWPGDASLMLFSDLDRESAGRVRERWARIPADAREQLVARSTELAEERVDLDFTQMYLAALDDEQADIRGLSVEALWESTDRRVAAKVVELLASDPDPEVRAAAATLLRQFVVMRELETFDAAEGDHIVETLRRAATDEGEALEVRARAVEAVGARSLPWVEDLITDAYNDEESRVRLAAIAAMGESGEEIWLDIINDELGSDDPAFRFEAVAAAGMIGSEESVESVAALLDDEDPDIARAAVMALGEIGGAAALRRLNAYGQRMPPGFEETLTDAIELARSGS